MDQLVKNEFYYFFSGYRNYKWARTWDHFMVAIYFINSIVIGLLYDYPLSQTIIILILFIILLGVTILFRPWKYFIFNICELIA